VSGYLGIHWITIKLRDRSKLGEHVAFLPPASLWGHLPSVQRMASQLADRGRPMISRTGES
jgi:hypothetical protein